MNPKFLPTSAEGRLARVTEECGEVVQAIGKVGRFGLTMRWPDKRFTDPRGPTNAEKLLGEIADLRHAIDAAEPDLLAIVEKTP